MNDKAEMRTDLVTVGPRYRMAKATKQAKATTKRREIIKSRHDVMIAGSKAARLRDRRRHPSHGRTAWDAIDDVEGDKTPWPRSGIRRW